MFTRLPTGPGTTQGTPVRRLTSTFTAVSMAATLAACGGPGAAPADPADAVAQGLDARLEDGFSFGVSLDLTDQARDSLSFDIGMEMVELLEDGLVSGAYQPPDRMSLSLGGVDPWLEFRTSSEAIYLRFDLDGFMTMTGEEIDVPSPTELQQMFQESGVSAEITTFLQAALDGRWVGITGLTEEAIQGLSQSLGMPTPEPGDVEDIEDVLERAGLLDGEELTDRYLIVTGGDGAYEVEVKARELMTALMQVATELGQYAEGFAPTDMPDPAEVPEQISGISITLDEGNKADLVTLDIVEMVTAFDPDVVAEEGLNDGDINLVIDFDDLDPSQVAAPEGAVTMDFETLVGGLMPLFMGFMGGMGGLDS